MMENAVVQYAAEGIVLILAFAAVVSFVVICVTAAVAGVKEYQRRYVEHAAQELEEIFVTDMAAEKIFAMAPASAGLLGLLGYLVTFKWGVALVLATAGWFVPRLLLVYLKRRRDALFGEQLVDALVTMANALRAGNSLIQALDVVATEMPPPISQEFGLVVREQRIGVSLDESLDRLAERMKSQDLDLVVNAVKIARQVGGNLAEIFEIIAATVRERFRLEGQIRALTAQGRMQGIVVGLLPVGLGAALYVIDPKMMAPMFETWQGWVLLGAIAVLEVIGGFIIKKIVSIDI